MTESTTELKREAAAEGAERTTPGAVFQPYVDIQETPEAVWLVADMPGVDETSADITLEKNVLTLRGTVPPPQYEGFSPVVMEYETGDFERSFTISSEIDQNGIEATVRNGVLRVKLPKSQRSGAQKIAIRAGS
jgi:HSP20 family molecular chaperone IbpA